MKWMWAAPCALWLCLSAWAAAASAAAGNDAKEVRAAVEGSVNAVLEVLGDKSLSREERKNKSMAIVDASFDLPTMGMIALGKNRPLFGKDQRERYTAIFINHIKDSYYDKMDLFNDEKVEFDDPVLGEKGKYKMLTRVVSKGNRYKLLYRLYKSGSAWRVYDVEIEGISLTRTYGADFNRFLNGDPGEKSPKKHTPEELLARLKEKAKEKAMTPSEMAKKQAP